MMSIDTPGKGYVQTQGINPYRWAPDADELVGYRNEIWHSVNNKSVAAIYPPVSQAFNALTYFSFGQSGDSSSCF